MYSIQIVFFLVNSKNLYFQTTVKLTIWVHQFFSFVHGAPKKICLEPCSITDIITRNNHLYILKKKHKYIFNFFQHFFLLWLFIRNLTMQFIKYIGIFPRARIFLFYVYNFLIICDENNNLPWLIYIKKLFAHIYNFVFK